MTSFFANYGIDRGIGGEVAKSYTDDTPYTPTWQEKITGVKADIAIATAREFADNAEKTKGRSMIIMVVVLTTGTMQISFTVQS